MINSLSLRHFKCFEELKLPLAPLSLLSGTNASGKSSVLQSLVLLHQTISEQEWSTRLMLNGSSLSLGTVLDVVNDSSGRRTIDISVQSDDAQIDWEFSGDRNEMSFQVERVIAGGVAKVLPTKLRQLVPPQSDSKSLALVQKIASLSYITAERLGPRQVYSLDDQQSTTSVGPRGEHTGSILYSSRDEPVLDALRIEGVNPTRRAQIEARMARFFPGFGLDIQPVANANSVVLRIRTQQGANYHRPTHVGFGLTQVLPIVVAALCAQPGQLILIENPEVHLHPAGQALMGAFLAEVANAGVQLIVETHSDHVLNGVRRATVTSSTALPPDRVGISFFHGVGAEPHHIQVKANGELSTWPRGFFDQIERDLGALARHRRSRSRQ